MKYLCIAFMVPFLFSSCIILRNDTQQDIAEKVTSGSEAELFMAIARNDIQATKKALADNADVNARHQGLFSAARLLGATPLYFAVFHENINLVKFLLDNGANPLIPNYSGELPVAYAEHKGLFDIVSVLKPYFCFPEQPKLDRAVYANIQMTCCRSWDIKKMKMDTFEIIYYKNVDEYAVHCDGVFDGILYRCGIRLDRSGNWINDAMQIIPNNQVLPTSH